MYNELHIKAIKTALDQIRKHSEAIQEYCTGECEKCPASVVCDWAGNLDYTEGRITDDLLDRFVEFHDEWQTAQDRKTFKEVTGIDPGWYDFHEDHTEVDF
jgi:hypothetical protein